MISHKPKSGELWFIVMDDSKEKRYVYVTGMKDGIVGTILCHNYPYMYRAIDPVLRAGKDHDGKDDYVIIASFSLIMGEEQFQNGGYIATLNEKAKEKVIRAGYSSMYLEGVYRQLQRCKEIYFIPPSNRQTQEQKLIREGALLLEAINVPQEIYEDYIFDIFYPFLPDHMQKLIEIENKCA